MKPMLRALAGETLETPPIWLMRQAGRYLPEYKATRAKAGGFLDLCYTPELAAEVTMQPIRRFGFDAAILFADILLVPQALGQELWFETGEGPRLTPVADTGALRDVDGIHETLGPVYETVSRVAEALPPETALIGFAGAPWTVATYMIAGRGTPDQAPAHRLMRDDPEAFTRIIDLVTEATIAYLARQIAAGAEIVKVFDSWAGSLEGDDFVQASVLPMKRIVSAIREAHPGVPIIGFPRGAGEASVNYVRETGVDGVAIGQDMSPEWARDHLQGLATVQGNLDPALMIEGGAAMKAGAAKVLEALGDGPFIFNLGHGITPEANPDHVADLVAFVRGRHD